MLLAIETSCPGGGVALVSERGLMGEITLASQRTYSQRLLPSIEWLMAQADSSLGQVEAIGVGLGPGSFTGVRIGVSTAKGLAFATGAAMVGVSGLDALAASLLPVASEVFALPLLDARKGQVFTALYRLEGNGFHRLTPYLAVQPHEIPSMIDAEASPIILVGDGLARHGADLISLFGGETVIAPRHLWYPRPGIVGVIGRLLLSQGISHDPSTLSPIYVRPSDAETGGRVKPFSQSGLWPESMDLSGAWT